MFDRPHESPKQRDAASKKPVVWPQALGVASMFLVASIFAPRVTGAEERQQHEKGSKVLSLRASLGESVPGEHRHQHGEKHRPDHRESPALPAGPRIVVLARGNARSWGAELLTKVLRAELLKSGHLFGQESGQRRHSEGGSEKPDHTLAVHVFAQREILQRRTGVHIGTNFLASAKLVDTKTGENKMTLRSRFRTRRAAMSRARAIARRAMTVLGVRQGGGEQDELEVSEAWGFELDSQFATMTYVGDIMALALRVAPEVAIGHGIAFYTEFASFYDFGAQNNDFGDATVGSFEDLVLGIGAEDVLIDGFGLRAGIELPTSRAAQAVGNVSTMVLSAEYSHSLLEYLALKAELSGRKYLPTIALGVVADRAEEKEGGEERYCSSTLRPTCVFESAMPPNFQLGAELSVGVAVPWVAGLHAALGLGYEFVQSNETEQGIEGMLEVSYRLTEHFELTGGALLQSGLGGTEPQRIHGVAFVGLLVTLGAAPEAE